jgi:hypothetical protein
VQRSNQLFLAGDDQALTTTRSEHWYREEAAQCSKLKKGLVQGCIEIVMGVHGSTQPSGLSGQMRTTDVALLQAFQHAYDIGPLLWSQAFKTLV